MGEHEDVGGRCSRCGMTAVDPAGRYWPAPCAGTLAEELSSYDRQQSDLMRFRREALERHGVER